ncbi:hypothetical protein TELCIR_22354 [Teladorsagia circumcincta]|uniref:ISXO2-like transposase domain-containing protein n=1 Tax=Teladorsagia circumcincta TaxID=45464 RepID=A0A2G9TE58_TELCI|nr:hypothetical protein TELCIR_22354 [Teladorsagia circumcincta]
MNPINDERRNGWICNRRACRTGPSNMTKVYVPARKDSFFEKSNLTESKVFALSYFWLRDMGKVNDKEYELNVGHTSVIQWEQFFRDVCVEHFRRNPPIIGGFGCEVEIDETLVTKRKYNRGRWVRRHQWLFGGIERGSGRAFLRLVRRRDASTLLRLIMKYIRPGTTILSDCWRAYSQIAALPNAYRHLQVNHQLNFVDPQSGAHTQNVESLWQKYKNMSKRRYGINNSRYKDYLCEFLWKKQFGGRREAVFNFWDQVAALYSC